MENKFFNNNPTPTETTNKGTTEEKKAEKEKLKEKEAGKKETVPQKIKRLKEENEGLEKRMSICKGGMIEITKGSIEANIEEIRELEEKQKEEKEKRKAKKPGMKSEKGKEENEKEGKKGQPSEAGEDKELIYRAKLEEAELSPEEKEKLEKTLAYVNQEKIEEELGGEIKEIANALAQEIVSPEQIEKLSKETGLPKEAVGQILNNQMAYIENLALARFREKKNKKTSRWEKILKIGEKTLKTAGKIGLYYGVGYGLSFVPVLGGVGSSLVIGGVRFIDIHFGEKKRKKEMNEAQEMMQEILKSEAAEEIKKEIEKNILNELAVAKQLQIEGKEKDNSNLGKKVKEKEKSYSENRKIEDLDAIKDLYDKQKENELAAIKKYLEEQGDLSEEEITERMKVIGSLVEIENNQKIWQLQFQSKDETTFDRIKQKTSKILAPLAGGRTEGEKLFTAGVYTFAGYLARSCPVVRDIMLGYAGVEVGGAVAGLIIKKAKRFEVLRRVSSEELKKEGIPLEDVDNKLLSRAKAQLLDGKFKQENPIEYAKLREQIFAIERAKCKKTDDRITDATIELEETIKEKASKEKQAKIIKTIAAIGGGVGGFFGGEAMNNRAQEKAEAKAEADVEQPEAEVKVEEMPVAEAPEISGIEIAEKGDSTWAMLERQLEKRGCFDGLEGTPEEIEAQKTYIIDSFKDKVAANPKAFGLTDVGTVQANQKIDFSSLFEQESDVNNVLEQAKSLSPEALENIYHNNQELARILRTPVEKISDEDLARVIEMGGGVEQMGPGIKKELNERINEIIRENNAREEAINNSKSQLDELNHLRNEVIENEKLAKLALIEKQQAKREAEDLFKKAEEEMNEFIEKDKGLGGRVRNLSPKYNEEKIEVGQHYIEAEDNLKNATEEYNKVKAMYEQAKADKLTTLKKTYSESKELGQIIDQNIDSQRVLAEKYEILTGSREIPISSATPEATPITTPEEVVNMPSPEPFNPEPPTTAPEIKSEIPVTPQTAGPESVTEIKSEIPVTPQTASKPTPEIKPEVSSAASHISSPETAVPPSAAEAAVASGAAAGETIAENAPQIQIIETNNQITKIFKTAEKIDKVLVESKQDSSYQSVKFDRGENGEINTIVSEFDLKNFNPEKNLNHNWEKLLSNDSQSTKDFIMNYSRKIEGYKRVLDNLPKKSEEAAAVKNEINEIIKTVEGEYGDVFKKKIF